MWGGQQFLDEKYSGTALNKIILNYKCLYLYIMMSRTYIAKMTLELGRKSENEIKTLDIIKIYGKV